MRTSAGLGPLPNGSHLNELTGVFTWAPGVGYVGTYHLVFVRRVGTDPVARNEVRGDPRAERERCGGASSCHRRPEVAARCGAAVLARWMGGQFERCAGHRHPHLACVGQPVGGWTAGFPGRDSLWRRASRCRRGAWKTVRGIGIRSARPCLAPGHYDLAVFGWSTERANFVPARTVRVTIRP